MYIYIWAIRTERVLFLFIQTTFITTALISAKAHESPGLQQVVEQVMAEHTPSRLVSIFAIAATPGLQFSCKGSLLVVSTV